MHDTPQTAAGDVLTGRDLVKCYTLPDTGATVTVVDVPRFSLPAAAQVAIEGASGSGKTTFLNLLAGILQPDSGTVTVAGLELFSTPESRRDLWRGRHIGYVFQTFNLLQGYSALENVLLAMMFGRGADAAVAMDLLARVGLSDRAHHRPRELSAGQQQRVAIARALANHPALVLADEPTGNLDAERGREALALLRDVCAEQNAALLVVSHDHGILRQFPTVVPFTSINRAAPGGGSA